MARRMFQEPQKRFRPLFRIYKQYLFLMWRIHLVVSDGNTVAVEPVGSPGPEGDKKEIIVVQSTFSNGAVI